MSSTRRTRELRNRNTLQISGVRYSWRILDRGPMHLFELHPGVLVSYCQSTQTDVSHGSL